MTTVTICAAEGSLDRKMQLAELKAVYALAVSSTLLRQWLQIDYCNMYSLDSTLALDMHVSSGVNYSDG